jgi:hypothetical protein
MGLILIMWMPSRTYLIGNVHPVVCLLVNSVSQKVIAGVYNGVTTKELDVSG